MIQPVIMFELTIDVHMSPFPSGTLNVDIVCFINDYFAVELQHKVVSIQVCPNRVARVTFAKGGEAAKAFFEELGCIVLNGVRCEVIRPPPPVSTVIAYWYPYEGLNSDNKTEIKKLGAHQSWPGIKVYTSSWDGAG